MTTAARLSFLDSVEVNPQPDYSCVIDGNISPRYNSLSHPQKEYVLCLWMAGEKILAQRVADCYRIGALHKTCSRGKVALGYKYRCGDMFCGSCYKPKLRLKRFSDSRDHSIFSHVAVGIEFFDSMHLPRLREHVRDFIKLHIGPDALMVDAVDSKGEVSVRCVIPVKGVDRKKLQRLWSGRLSVQISDYPYTWSFSGMTDVMGVSATEKADLRIRVKGDRLVRTIGTFYAPSQKPKQEHSPTQCPVCKDHDLDDIPLSNRRQEPVEDIETRFELVIWGPEKVIRRDYPTNKFLGADWVFSPAVEYPPSPPLC